MKRILKILLFIYLIFMILKLIYGVRLEETEIPNLDKGFYSEDERKKSKSRIKSIPDDFDYKKGFLKDGEVFKFSQGNNDVEIKAINKGGYPRRIIKVGNVLKDTKNRLKIYPEIGIYGPDLGFMKFTTPIHFMYDEFFYNFKDYNSLLEEMKISKKRGRSFFYYLNEDGIAPVLIVRKNPKGDEIFIQVTLQKVLIDGEPASPEDLKKIFQDIKSIE